MSAVVMRQLVLSSRLAVQAGPFWDEQSLLTVNQELGPWLRMTVPAPWRDLRLKDWRDGGRLFGSWVLLLGVVPLDRHAFGSLELGQDMRFVERSSSGFARVWRHERVVRSVPGGCEVTDTVGFVPRLACLAPLLKAIYILVFRHRHARLRACYPMPPMPRPRS